MNCPMSDNPELPAHINLGSVPPTAHLKASVLSMGLKRIDEAQWLCREGLNFDAYRANKIDRTGELGSKVLDTSPACAAAVAELRAGVEQATEQRIDALGSVSEQLYALSLCVAEDLCILLPSNAGYLLAGAHLCAPSHWRLEDKIGKSMDPIHAPVPGYDASLARSVNRFLDKMPEGQFIARFNWSLDAEPTLCQRPAVGAAMQQGALAWYRTERQTLRRLPRSGAIVFAILVQQWPLWHMATRPDDQALLLQAIERLSPTLRAYKNLHDGRTVDWSKPSSGS